VLLTSRVLTGHWTQSLVADREINRLEAEVGQRVAVVITVRNQGRVPVPWALLEDLLPLQALIHRPPNLAVSGRRVRLATFRPGGAQTIAYQLTCHRRGYYQLGPLIVETGDLFGLYRRYRVVTKPHFLTVYPRTVPLAGYDIASRRPVGEVRMTHRLYEDPTRVAGVRHYQAGDPLNRVHWGATARTGQLHSKVYEPSSVAGATILLDFHHDSHPARHEPLRSELAVTAAAALAQTIYELGQQVGLVTNGRDAADRIRYEGWACDVRSRNAARRSASMLPRSQRLRPQIVPPARGAGAFLRIREALARLELTDGLTFGQTVAESTPRLPRDASVVALLQVVTEQHAIALGNLRRQGYAVTAILNVYERDGFVDAARHLLAEGIPIHHLRDEASISEIARLQATGALPAQPVGLDTIGLQPGD
jgi:uncharacterized protein (DUF58 family)